MFVAEVLHLAFVQESIPVHIIHRPQLLQQELNILLIVDHQVSAAAALTTILALTYCESSQRRPNHLILLKKTLGHSSLIVVSLDLFNFEEVAKCADQFIQRHRVVSISVNLIEPFAEGVTRHLLTVELIHFFSHRDQQLLHFDLAQQSISVHIETPEKFAG